MIIAFKSAVSYPQYPITFEESRCLRWIYLRQCWLYRGERSKSEARASRRSTEEWLCFLEPRQEVLMPWSVTAADVAEWIDHLAGLGRKPPEIRKRLRDCDDWYQYVAQQTATRPDEIAGPVVNPFRKLG